MTTVASDKRRKYIRRHYREKLRGGLWTWSRVCSLMMSVLPWRRDVSLALVRRSISVPIDITTNEIRSTKRCRFSTPCTRSAPSGTSTIPTDDTGDLIMDLTRPSLERANRIRMRFPVCKTSCGARPISGEDYCSAGVTVPVKTLCLLNWDNLYLVIYFCLN